MVCSLFSWLLTSAALNVRSLVVDRMKIEISAKHAEGLRTIRS
jgi:hypothetical protein